MIYSVISLLFQLLAGTLPIVVFFYKNTWKYFEIFIYLTASILATCIIIYTRVYELNNHWVHNAFIVLSFISIGIFYIKRKVLILKYSVLISAFIFLVILGILEMRSQKQNISQRMNYMKIQKN